MIIICTASADTYITDKIINSSYRATDANVGQASTLDLFKLYDETRLNGSGSQTELSRILLKFDLAPILQLTSSILDLNSSDFSVSLELKDIMTGHAVPRNFTASVFPLSRSFDEGEGLDTGKFDDIHVANFITASYTTQNNLWFSQGANAGGLLGSNNIDYITSGNLNDGNGLISFENKQTFIDGTEDLAINLTQIISATLAQQIPDYGFRLSFTGSQESDLKTRFVKRFASRHVTNSELHPRLVVRFNDSITDNHRNFTFDNMGTLYLNSFAGSSYANLVSGSSLTPITGQNCLLLQLNKGNFNFYVTGSQRTAGTNGANVAGQYYATFSLPSTISTRYDKTTSIADLLSKNGEVEFTTYWKSLDDTIAYHTGSLTMKRAPRNSGISISREPQITVLNITKQYEKNDTVRIRIFGRDLINENSISFKRPIKLPSVIYENVYYQVVDRITGKIVLPYDNVTNSTKVSTDSDGMYFDFKMSALVPGRSYAFDFLIVERGTSFLVQNRDAVFVVKDR